MPELPEVEVVRRSLQPHLVGQRIIAVQIHEDRLREQVDRAALARLLPGQTIVGLRRRGKYLLLDLSNATVLLVHLGMSGRFGMHTAQAARQKHDHVVLTLGSAKQLRFNDARRFGMMACFARGTEQSHPRLAQLGAEPLDANAFCGASLYAATRGLSQPIKHYLMDARRQVGVGNIYACESLHAAGVHPRRAAGRLSAKRCSHLVEAVRRTLRDAIELGGTTLRDFLSGDGEAGYFGQRLRVYGRAGQPCGTCGVAIRRVVQCGRSTFYCVACQR